MAQINVDFTVDVREGCNTVQSQFTDLSSSTAGVIVSWEWQIGDITSTIENPGRVFSDPGFYQICLQVTDNQGNIGSHCKEDFIKVYGPPIADFEFDNSAGCAPLLVNFSDLSTSPNGEIVTWQWGLGGTEGTQIVYDVNEPISTVYENDGFQTVSLHVTDDKGCTNSITKQNIIRIEDRPEIIISTIEPVGCKFPMIVDFENFGINSGIEYHWDFGNGESFQGFNPDPIVYSLQGDYDVVVSAMYSGSDCVNTLVLKDYISAGGNIEFDFSPKLGCAGLEVQFEDQSIIDSDDWLWDFGDGNTSSSRDPIHRYSTPGTYQVSLYRNTGDCAGTKISEFDVVVLEDPVIDATLVNDESCLLPANISFNVTQESNTSYTWILSDGSNTIASLSGGGGNYTFSEFGNYDLTLLASNVAGCVSSMQFDSIKIEPLSVEFEGVLEGCVPFDANITVQSNSTSPISSIQWDIDVPFPTSEQGNNLIFTVDQTGSFDGSAIVTNQLGCKDTISASNLIMGGESPIVDFNVSETIACPRELINFIDLSVGEIDSWTWTIGDSLVFDTQELSTEINIPGTYDVTLLVGSEGCEVSKTVEDLIKINPPGAGLELVYNCENPYSVTAIDVSTFSDANLWKYVLGSDTLIILNQDSIEISLPSRGSFPIQLEALHDASGCTNVAFDDIEVTVPEANFEMDKTEGCTPLEVQFSDLSTDANEWQYFTSSGAFIGGSNPDATLNLKFGGTYEEQGLIVRDIHGCADTTFSAPIRANGIKADFAIPAPVCFSDTLFLENTSFATFADITSSKWILGENEAISEEMNAVFTAPDIGKFDLKLIVEDSWGCIDSMELGLGAFFKSPNFELIADTLSCTDHEVRFRNGLHSGGYSYTWNFGDGNSSDEINPTHIYADEGDYMITIMIEDETQCANQMDLSQTIRVYDPVANFTVDSTFSACPPLIPNFNNSSINAIDYIWDFGDGTGVDNNDNPMHLFTSAGSFDVTLIAIRSENCQDTIILNDLIKLDGPRGEITFEVDSSCVPLNVNFEAALEEEYTMTWDFGDGVLEVVPGMTNSSSIEHDYENAGNFIPKIILTNDQNCTIIREGDNIQAHDLKANFTAMDSVFCDVLPAPIYLEDLSESTGDIVSVEWEVSGPADFNLIGDMPNFSIEDTGFYNIKLIVENEFCIDSLTKSNFLKVGYRPNPQLPSDTVICNGDQIDLNFLTLESDEIATWSNGFENLSTTTVMPSASQQFYLIVENKYLCKSEDSIFIDVNVDTTRFAGADRTICSGAETTVEILFSDEVYWPTVLNCFDCTKVMLNPDSSEMFPVVARNNFGCLVRDSIFIEVLDDTDIDAGEDQKICEGESAVLLAYTLGDYNWTPQEFLSHPSDQLTSATVNASTLFTLTSTKGECTLHDSVLVDIVDKAELSVLGDTICEGEIAELIVNGSVDEVFWEVDESLSKLEGFTNTSNTTTDRSYTVIGNLTGCSSDTAIIDVKVLPSVNIRLPEEINYFPGETSVSIDLEILSSGNFSFMWSPADLVPCSSCEDVTIDVNGDVLDLQVAIENEDTGCNIERTIRLRAFDNCDESLSRIGIPNIFSPNDDGFNDFLEIELPYIDEIEDFLIFDRWGQLVYRTKNKDASWDGRFNDQPVQSGVYSYQIKAICPINNKVILKSGDITVIK